ncbi:unnamed protein product [Paramecium primaurelia]|uniref:Cilia-and flagella-associated protein 96 n=1 Tax=Paramecium primaurelia TaxID=5886 RepID=A0A8S1NZJ1_PARPR|nr:unnamed protein product [Paramecium primaurelia]
MSDELAKLKKEILQDTELQAKKQRFALFSSPVPLGLGDDSYDFKNRPPRGENGKPITQPNNVKIGAPKSGRIKSSYFSQASFNSIGDPYKDPQRKDLQYELEKTKKILFKDQPFKPASGYKELLGGPWPHMKEFDMKKTRNYKTADGRVWSAPRNITTNPANKDLSKGYPHLKDEYDRFHQYQLKLQMEAKRKEKEVAFRTTIAGGENFNKDKQVFGFDGKAPPSSKEKPHDMHIMKHEQNFKPANPGKKGFEGEFEQITYKPDPVKPLKRKEWPKGKEQFKPNNLGTLTRPTPSITCFKQNIRRVMSAKGF